MRTDRTRREFLSSVGQGMLVVSIGSQLATDMGLAKANAAEGAETLSFGPLESLVGLMQDTPIEKLMPTLVEQLKSGIELKHWWPPRHWPMRERSAAKIMSAFIP